MLTATFRSPSLCKLNMPTHSDKHRQVLKQQFGQTTVQSKPNTSFNQQYNFSAPHGKPPDKGKEIKRPKLNRPPKSDSEIPTSNKYKSLDTEADDGSTSESDFPNPFS